LTRLIRSLALMTVLKKLGCHTGPPPQTTTLQPAPGRSSHARTSRHRCRHRSRQLTPSQPPPRDQRQQPQLPSASHCRSRCTPPWRRNPAGVRVSSCCATVEPHQGRCHTTMAPHRPLGDAQCCATQPRRRCHTRGRPSASAQSSSARSRHHRTWPPPHRSLQIQLGEGRI
jgi:hypothetical protein